jgi:hypothetical protein
MACGAANEGIPMSAQWYEIWIDDTLDPPYVLHLRPADDGFQVIDPAHGNHVVFLAASYEEAMFWLTEDEYTKVERRDH